MDRIYTWPTWTLVAGLVALTVAATVIGYRAGRARQDTESDRAYGVTTGLKASVLGLVALILGFTYSMTSSRFDERQRLVLDEANAIGTCYLRAGLLKPATTDSTRDALRRYTDLRMALYEQALDPEAVRRISQEMDGQLSRLWAQVEQSARDDPDLTYYSSIVPAANTVIDLSSTRAWMMRNHVPPSVLLMLGVCMVASGALTGQSFGQVGRRSMGLWAIQNLVLAVVLYVILDFDRPRRGLIKVNHQPLVELRSSLNR
jgi:hypothetical protein